MIVPTRQPPTTPEAASRLRTSRSTVSVFVICSFKRPYMHARACWANPYDGHTLGPALEQVAILTDHLPDLAVVDRG